MSEVLTNLSAIQCRHEALLQVDPSQTKLNIKVGGVVASVLVVDDVSSADFLPCPHTGENRVPCSKLQSFAQSSKLQVGGKPVVVAGSDTDWVTNGSQPTKVTVEPKQTVLQAKEQESSV